MMKRKQTKRLAKHKATPKPKKRAWSPPRPKIDRLIAALEQAEKLLGFGGHMSGMEFRHTMSTHVHLNAALLATRELKRIGWSLDVRHMPPGDHFRADLNALFTKIAEMDA